MEPEHLPQQPEEQTAPEMTAGQSFVRFLRPGGCVVVLALFVLFLVYCLAPRSHAVEGYTPVEVTSAQELQRELEENLLPRIEPGASCKVRDGKAAVTVPAKSFGDVRSAVLYYYDKELLTFTAEK